MCTPKPLFCFKTSYDGDSTAFLDFDAALICYVCIYSEWLLRYQSFCHVGRLEQKAHTHTHRELFEILTYLIQLNHKDSTLCMIAGLQLQNVVNGKPKGSVHSLPERREDLLGTPRISSEL